MSSKDFFLGLCAGYKRTKTNPSFKDGYYVCSTNNYNRGGKDVYGHSSVLEMKCTPPLYVMSDIVR